MRDYLIFVGVFLAFLYCGFSTDKLEIRQKLTDQFTSGSAGFETITSTAKFKTWIDGMCFFPMLFCVAIISSMISLITKLLYSAKGERECGPY